MFRSFQIIIRDFRRSFLKLLHIHDLVRFCKQGVVAAYHIVQESVVESVVGQVCVVCCVRSKRNQMICGRKAETRTIAFSETYVDSRRLNMRINSIIMNTSCISVANTVRRRSICGSETVRCNSVIKSSLNLWAKFKIKKGGSEEN